MVHPVDPGSHWLAAGITGIPRQKEWDAVVTADAPGTAGDEAEFVALSDGRVLVGAGPDGFDPEPLAAALEGAIERPYRALAMRRPELWSVGASAIETARLDPDPRGDDLELTWDGSTLALSVDGMPAEPSGASALERLAASRESGAYAAHAGRLDGDLWEILVLPL
ncbi:MAG: hypothetical protein OEW52_05525 [Thermoleophilia bacterium]|nr:hypothetical protein [Thermoleophilia bacterium]MDH4339154.1 hypothetical protein [Thermoleophilia bacterium]MDH5280598.1 hypothetical protein [Thermoleophilia bacterium]